MIWQEVYWDDFLTESELARQIRSGSGENSIFVTLLEASVL